MGSTKPRTEHHAKNRLSGKNMHKAIWCAGPNVGVVAILHNIRSLQNVGAMFRTADGAGIKNIILTGYTPTPTDVLGSVRKEFAKTALGAEKYIKWEQKKLSACIRTLKQEGYYIYAIEHSRNSINLFSYKIKKPFALIVGNEVRGLSKNVLEQCDAALHIPMHGKKESLNVSVAFGIAVYALVK